MRTATLKKKMTKEKNPKFCYKYVFSDPTPLLMSSGTVLGKVLQKNLNALFGRPNISVSYLIILISILRLMITTWVSSCARMSMGKMRQLWKPGARPIPAETWLPSPFSRTNLFSPSKRSSNKMIPYKSSCSSFKKIHKVMKAPTGSVCDKVQWLLTFGVQTALQRLRNNTFGQSPCKRRTDTFLISKRPRTVDGLLMFLSFFFLRINWTGSLSFPSY